MIFKCSKCGEEVWRDGRNPDNKRKTFFYEACSSSGVKERLVLVSKKKEYDIKSRRPPKWG